jgi:excisionase family DNA binding protein
MRREKHAEGCYGAPQGVPYRLQYRTEEAASLLGLSPRTLTTMVQEQTIASYKLRGIRLFARSELEAFVETLQGKEQPSGASAN